MNLRQIFAGVSVDPIDLLALSSVAVLAIGVAMFSMPAAFIVVGILGLAYAVLASRTGVTP